MMQFKPEVRIVHLTEQLAEVLRAASFWSVLKRVGVEVNSIDDGTHGVGSLHGSSLAVDLDTVGDRPDDLATLFAFLRRVLPMGYDILYEDDHVHVEWDTHRVPRHT